MPEVKFQVGAVYVSTLSPIAEDLWMSRLFDMDGTLVDSTTGVIGAWETFAKTYPGLDVKTILHSNYPTSRSNHTGIQTGLLQVHMASGPWIILQSGAASPIQSCSRYLGSRFAYVCVFLMLAAL